MTTQNLNVWSLLKRSFLSAACIAFSAEALAGGPGTPTIDGIKYSLNASDHIATVNGYDSSTPMNVIIIPDSVKFDDKWYKVTDVADGAFKENENLKSIGIPSSVNKIGKGVFESCINLDSIKIFRLEPEGLTFDNEAFPEGATIYVPANTRLKYEAEFPDCTCTFKEFMPKSIVVDDVVYSVISDSTVSLVHLNNCKTIENFEIEDTVVYGDFKFVITEFAAGALNKCTELKTAKIPNTVIKIGEAAFIDCSSLTSVEIPNSVKSIGTSAFLDCKNLKNIDLPDSLVEISQSTFNGCSSLVSVDLPNSLIKIGQSAFINCSSLTSVELPNSLVEIASSAFVNCSSLDSVKIPNSVTKIESSAFAQCSNLAYVEIPNSVKQIEPYVFGGCSKIKDFLVKQSNPENISCAALGFDLNRVTLYVPYGSKSKYENMEPWENFGKIVDSTFFEAEIFDKNSFDFEEWRTKSTIGYVTPDTKLTDNKFAVVLDTVEADFDITKSKNVIWNVNGEYKADSIVIQDALSMTLPSDADGYGYSFHVNAFCYDRIPASDTVTFVSPVPVPADKLNGTAYAFDGFDESNLSLHFSKVTDDILADNTPYVVVVADKNKRLIEDIVDVEWNKKEDYGKYIFSVIEPTSVLVDHVGNLGGHIIYVPAGAGTVDFIFNNGKLCQADTISFRPFRTLISIEEQAYNDLIAQPEGAKRPSSRPHTFGISFDDNTTGVVMIENNQVVSGVVTVYDALGRVVRANVESTTCLQGLNPGVYVVNGQKFIVKE